MTQLSTHSPQPTSKPPTRRRLKVVLLGLLGAATLTAVFSSGAIAEEAAHRARTAYMRRVVSSRLDQALTAAKVTDRQRETIHGAKDRVFDAIAKTKRGKQDLEEVLSLFEQNQLDRERISALRKAREAELTKIGDTVEEALVDVHATLTPAQRKALTEYVWARHKALHP